MLREIEGESLEQVQLPNGQLTQNVEFSAHQLHSQERVIGFESIFAQPFVQALGKTDKGIDYAGSCDCDAGCFSGNCNCVIGCT